MIQKNILELAHLLGDRSEQERLYVLKEINKTILEVFNVFNDMNTKNVTNDYLGVYEHNKPLYQSILNEPLIIWFALEFLSENKDGYLTKHIQLTPEEKELYLKYKKEEFKLDLDLLEIPKVCDLTNIIHYIKEKRKPYPEVTAKAQADTVVAPTPIVAETPVETSIPAPTEEVPPTVETEEPTLNVEATPKEETAEEQDDTSQETENILANYQSRITLEVDKILDVYSGLYKAGMELENPLGILTALGYYTLSQNCTPILRMDSVLGGVYKHICTLLGPDCLVLAPTSAAINLNNVIDKAYSYYPHCQVYPCYGYVQNAKEAQPTHYKTWDAYRVAAKKSTLNIMTGVVKSCIKTTGIPKNDDELQVLDEFVNHVIEEVRFALTNSVVIYDFDPKSSIKLRFYSQNSKINRKVLEDAIFRSKNSLFANKGEIAICEPNENGVYTIAIIFDKVAEGKKPLFAYQAIEALQLKGQKPSWNNFILGKDVKTDTMLTINLADNDHYNCVIGAGPRSGKGVTTLNILAVALSQQFPVLYLDGKPEMAKELWKLAEKYETPFLALDVNDRYKNMPYTNYPKEVENKVTDLGGVTAYLKGIQMGLLLAMLRYENNDENRELDIKVKTFDIRSKTRMVIVCDEIVKFKVAYNNLYMPLKALATKHKKEPEVYDYITHILEWMDNLDSQLIGNFASEIPMARQNWFWLTQDLVKGTWGVGSGDGEKNVVRNSIRKAKTMKLCGNGMTTSNNTLALPQKQGSATTDAEAYINETQKCFAYHLSQEPTSYEGIKIIKPYLVLPTIEPNSEAVKGLLSIPRESLGKAYDESGNMKAEVGFEGLVTLIAEGNPNVMKDGLSLCYDLLHVILTRAGLLQKYSNLPYDRQVYGFFYDLDISTFISTPNLAKLVRANGAPVELASESKALFSEEEDLMYTEEPLAPKSLNEVLYGEYKPTSVTPIAGANPGMPGTPQTNNPHVAQLMKQYQDSIKAPGGEMPPQDVVGNMPISPSTPVAPVTPMAQANPMMGDVVPNDTGTIPVNFMENKPSPYGNMDGMQGQVVGNPNYGAMPNQGVPNMQYGEGIPISDIQDYQDYDEYTAYQQQLQEQLASPILVKPNVMYDNTNTVTVQDRRLAQPYEDGIDCTYARRVDLPKYKQVLMNTPLGTDIYVKQLWKNILYYATSSSNQGVKKALVKRVNIFGDNLYLNGRLVNLNGIIGGYDGVRLTDIVDFKLLFKTFKGVAELGLDDETLCKLFMQYNIKDLQEVFRVIPSLETLYILSPNAVQTFTRLQFDKAKADFLSKKTQATRAMEEYRYKKTQGNVQMERGNRKDVYDAWSECTSGRKVWGSSVGKNCLDNAFSTKKKGLGKRVLYLGTGVAVGVTGGLTWFGFNSVRTLRNLRRKD